MSDDAVFLHLPEIPGAEISLVHRVDYWDGPISGLVRHGSALLWFQWLQEDHDGPRRYLLHPLPVEDISPAETWLQRDAELHDEFRLVANPHCWPASARQRATFRSEDTIAADMKAHAQMRPPWEKQPATAWFTECGQAFAAIQTCTMTKEESDAFAAWQIAVARALATEDQPALDRLFPTQPGPRAPLDLYMVTRPGPGDDQRTYIIRDWRGQPLPEDFLMTAKHRVQNFAGLVPRHQT